MIVEIRCNPRLFLPSAGPVKSVSNTIQASVYKVPDLETLKIQGVSKMFVKSLNDVSEDEVKLCSLLRGTLPSKISTKREFNNAKEEADKSYFL